jgi:hypothetical protein
VAALADGGAGAAGDRGPRNAEENHMTPGEIAKVQAYLRKLFGNDKIQIKQPGKRGAPVEFFVGEEFVGVVHRDDEDGDVSYALQISILEEDLLTLGSTR